ncbi:MAG TPA: Type 1 glutamine amidotransferase-like domain-containing protein [Candidatus Limnocylindrales bacterium]|jgi:cyanophycinase-like exopeptidase
MDALLAAARAAAGPSEPVVVILPTAAARQRPEQAAAQGERAFRAAATRAGTGIAVLTAPILTRADAADPELVGMLAGAHLIHVPGGDPDLVPSVLRDTLAWAAILEGLDRGMCLAGASAGAMALGERVWTSRGGVDGLGLLPGVAVIPHFVAGRLDAWRPVVEAGRPLAWIGIDEQTLVMGRPGETWSVAGRGRIHVVPVGALEPALVAGPGAAVPIG